MKKPPERATIWMGISEKNCTCCNQIRPASEFYRDRRYGLQSECKACVKARSATRGRALTKLAKLYPADFGRLLESERLS